MKRITALGMLIPLLTTAYQTSIKLATAHIPPGLSIPGWLEYAVTNGWMLAAIASELLSFFIWMQILSRHNLSKAFPLTGVSYILILGVSWLGFKEPLIPSQLIGCTLILIGIWLIGTADAPLRNRVSN